jgi:hypothetical protein
MTRSGLTVEFKVHIRHGNRGRRRLRAGLAPESAPAATGAVPRVSRLMALAIHLDMLLRAGLVRDFADIARLALVSRARVTQVMNLLLLAPDIQEDILFLPRIADGTSSLVAERQLRPIAALVDWAEQRRVWRARGLPEVPPRPVS